MSANCEVRARHLNLFKLSEQKLREIYEKTIDKMTDEMIETSENCFELEITREDLDKYMIKLIIECLVRDNPELTIATKEEMAPHVAYNMRKLKQIINSVEEEE